MGFAEKYGPWALIAGASEGTGAAFARRIAREGVNCILLARRPGPLETLAAELRSEFGVEVATASVDLTAPDAVDAIVAAVGDREVGLFVSNAGSDMNNKPFLDAPADSWAQVVQVNVMTALRVAHHFAAPMRARGRGGILFVNSGACYGGMPGMAIYTGVKSFLLSFTESLWAELNPHGVDVLTIVLGRTNTPAYKEWCEAQGQTVGPGVAEPTDVAEEGISHLANGPVRNWGQDNDATSPMPVSAASRNERIRMIQKAMQGRG